MCLGRAQYIALLHVENRNGESFRHFLLRILLLSTKISPMPACNEYPTDLFSDSYEEARQKFKDSLAIIRQLFPNAQHQSHSLSIDPALTIDWITSEPPAKEKLFILTTGQHGLEGFTGAAVQQLFIHEYLPMLDHATTGLLLVHAINPWGMKHRRKVNGNNVDLNRNFNLHSHEYDPLFNPVARQLEQLVYPRIALRASWINRVLFYLRVIANVLRVGRSDFMAGALMGQYCFPDGIYYGGTEAEEETQVMMRLYQSMLAAYSQVVHLDMHTGYGPRRQMSLVNTPHELASSAELAARFGYPLVQKSNAEEFYATRGDMIGYLHQLKSGLPHIKRFYASTFEFGTYGDSLLDGIRSLAVMVFEMQARCFGVKSVDSGRWIERKFDDLYDIRDEKWVNKALADARQAFEGILKAEGYWE
ncbi:MAG: hypothetical protein C0391_01570 [Anaerolinea sp.]|nr:hypothetical protein [Anaerolinea sp.]